MSTVQYFILNHAPVSVQNLFISLYGFRLNRIRFGSEFRKQLIDAKARQDWTHEEILEFQLNELKRVVANAYDNSSFYRSLYRRDGVSPDTINTLEDIRKLPIVEKSDLQKNVDEVVVRTTRERLVSRRTSGTTGTPLVCFSSASDRGRRFAFLFRLLSNFGISEKTRSIKFSGKYLFYRSDKDKIFWRMNYSRNQLLMSSYHLDSSNIEFYLNKMVDFKPVYIDGYPSSIYSIAKYMVENGISIGSFPKVIMTTGETLLEDQKAMITKAFPEVTILNQYASSEGAPFITPDSKGELVLNIDSGVFEFFKPGTNIPAAPGEVGELVVTSFFTDSFPLIRYRIGDAVELLEEYRLSDDVNMPIVKSILGRMDDLVYTRERGGVGRLSPALTVAPSTVAECQIIQTSIDSFILKVVPNPGFVVKDMDVTVRELKHRLGDVSIEVQLHESLDRGPNGKFRNVIGLPLEELRE
jgi:phenylacetate-CoA ligase